MDGYGGDAAGVGLRRFDNNGIASDGCEADCGIGTVPDEDSGCVVDLSQYVNATDSDALKKAYAAMGNCIFKI